MTHSVTLVQSIAALRKVYSITSSASGARELAEVFVSHRALPTR